MKTLLIGLTLLSSMSAFALNAGENATGRDRLLSGIFRLTNKSATASFKGTNYARRQNCLFSVSVSDGYINLSVSSAGKTLSRVISPGEAIKYAVEDNESFPGVIDSNYLFPNGDSLKIGVDGGTGDPFELSLKINRQVIGCHVRK